MKIDLRNSISLQLILPYMTEECSKINGFDDLLFSDFPKNEMPKSVFGDSQTFLGMFLGELVLVKFYSGGALCEKKVIREDARNAH